MRKSVGLKRLFVSFPEPIVQLPLSYTLQDSEKLHYVRTVLRARVSEAFVLVDGEARQAYAGNLTELDKQQAVFEVKEALQTQGDSMPSVTLAVALIKEHRWDWLLQKATELGAEIIQPLLTERTVVHLDAKTTDKKLDRWRGIVESAAAQSEVLFIPKIQIPLTVTAWCKRAVSQADTRHIILAERGEQRQPLYDVLSANKKPPSDIYLAIGPEGGWTNQELETFHSAGYHFASLGQRILRSETAAISAMASVVYQFSG